MYMPISTTLLILMKKLSGTCPYRCLDTARVQTWQQTVRMWNPPGALLRPADWKIFRQSLNGDEPSNDGKMIGKSWI